MASKPLHVLEVERIHAYTTAAVNYGMVRVASEDSDDAVGWNRRMTKWAHKAVYALMKLANATTDVHSRAAFLAEAEYWQAIEADHKANNRREPSNP